MKKYVSPLLLIYVVWSVLDIIVHGWLLMDIYRETAHLWRPEAEIKAMSMYLSSLIVAVTFMATYVWLVKGKSVGNGLLYGGLIGVMSAVRMGLGTYSYMPIPEHLACSWAVSELVKYLAAGCIVGYFCRES